MLVITPSSAPLSSSPLSSALSAPPASTSAPPSAPEPPVGAVPAVNLWHPEVHEFKQIFVAQAAHGGVSAVHHLGGDGAPAPLELELYGPAGDAAFVAEALPALLVHLRCLYLSREVVLVIATSLRARSEATS